MCSEPDRRPLVLFVAWVLSLPLTGTGQVAEPAEADTNAAAQWEDRIAAVVRNPRRSLAADEASALVERVMTALCPAGPNAVEWARQAAIVGLGSATQHVAAIPVLEAIATDSQVRPEWRSAAVRSLATTADPLAVEAMLRVLAATAGEGPRMLELCAVENLSGMIGSPPGRTDGGYAAAYREHWNRVRDQTDLRRRVYVSMMLTR